MEALLNKVKYTATEEELCNFSKSKSYEVRKYVALNHNTPIKILQKLLKDSNIEVSKAAKRNLLIFKEINISF